MLHEDGTTRSMCRASWPPVVIYPAGVLLAGMLACLREVVGLLCMLVFLRGLVNTHLTNASFTFCTPVACKTPWFRPGDQLAVVGRFKHLHSPREDVPTLFKQTIDLILAALLHIMHLSFCPESVTFVPHVHVHVAT